MSLPFRAELCARKSSEAARATKIVVQLKLTGEELSVSKHGMIAFPPGLVAQSSPETVSAARRRRGA
jgi:hypothetical protein